MEMDEILKMTDGLIFKETGKHLDYLQEAILRGCIQGQAYKEIAEKQGFSESHVKNVGYALWKTLSKALGEEVSKKNVRSVLKNIKNIKNDVSSSHNYPSTIVSGVCQSSFTINNNLSISPDKKDQSSLSSSSSSHQTILDLTEVPTIASSSQRPTELETLQKWILQDRTRIITILGLSGIGKTALTLTLIEQIKPQFDYIIYRSLDTGQTLEKLLKSILQIFSQNTENQLPDNIDELRQTLLNFLRCHRCLIIFDDVQNILSSRELAGNYQPDQTNYSKLFKQIAELCHQSCLLLISWEPPIDIIAISQKNPFVKIYPLPGLEPTIITEIWQEIGLQDQEKWLDIINFYQGNPLWLNLIAYTIQDLFNGSVAEFSQISPLFLTTELQAILQQHWQRLADIELKIIEVLSKYPQGLTIKQIHQEIQLDPEVNPQILLNLANAVQSLTRRGLIEKKGQTKGTFFTLLPILHYI
jgi:ABC-type dipeptide/oligopeptide/nickel transport system ATPase subunit